jgi:hypothetical protein
MNGIYILSDDRDKIGTKYKMPSYELSARVFGHPASWMRIPRHIGGSKSS